MTQSEIENRIVEIDGEMTALQNDIDTAEYKKARLQAERDKLEVLLEEGNYEQDDSEK